jgi:hypothetical protein
VAAAGGFRGGALGGLRKKGCQPPLSRSRLGRCLHTLIMQKCGNNRSLIEAVHVGFLTESEATELIRIMAKPDSEPPACDE